MGRDFEGTSGPSTCFFEDKCDILTRMSVCNGNTFFLFVLEFCRKIQKIENFFRCKVTHLEEISSLKINHLSVLFSKNRISALRRIYSQ